MKFLRFVPGVAQLKLIFNGAIALAIVGALIWGGIRYHELLDLRKDNAVLIRNNKVLQQNTDTLRENYLVCQESNEVNIQTISDLIKERDDAERAVEELANQQQANIATIGALQSRLNDLRQDETNNGPLAPVLRETIRGIQLSGSGQ